MAKITGFYEAKVKSSSFLCGIYKPHLKKENSKNLFHILTIKKNLKEQKMCGVANAINKSGFTITGNPRVRVLFYQTHSFTKR